MSSFNTDPNASLSRRMTSIKSPSPSSLKLGDPISEKFETHSSKSSETSYNGPNYILYFLIILVFGILGINIFAYLGILSENLIGFFRPVLFSFAYYSSEAVKTTVDTSAEGSKLGIDVAAGTITSAIDLGQKAGNTIPDMDDELEESVINDNKLKKTINNKKPKNDEIVIPDESTSKTQQTKPSQKSGYCYIGEDRGFRSCIKVKEGDVCMSGNIFPSQEICVNPSLREGTDNYYYRDSIKKHH